MYSIYFHYIFFFPFHSLHSDVLTANDFAGEAFLALGNIPGVADYSTSIENFHGLKQVDLPLMQQNDKSTCVADLVFQLSSVIRYLSLCRSLPLSVCRRISLVS